MGAIGRKLGVETHSAGCCLRSSALVLQVKVTGGCPSCQSPRHIWAPCPSCFLCPLCYLLVCLPGQGIWCLWFSPLLQQRFNCMWALLWFWLLGWLGAFLTLGVYVVEAGVLDGLPRRSILVRLWPRFPKKPWALFEASFLSGASPPHTCTGCLCLQERLEERSLLPSLELAGISAACWRGRAGGSVCQL